MLEIDFKHYPISSGNYLWVPIILFILQLPVELS